MPDISRRVHLTKRMIDAKEKRRQRFLASAELAKLGDVLREVERWNVEHASVVPAVRLLIFTGARKGEILGRRWAWVSWTVEIDEVHGGRIKRNPLVRWSRQAVIDYVNQHHVPINRLHAHGYPTVGCAPCTRSIQPGEDERAGR